MIIGLHGAKHVGKDTALGFIRQHAEARVEGKSFAKLLKESAAASLGVEDYPIEWCNRFKEHGTITVTIDTGHYDISGREFLQWYGTEAHRDVFGKDFWVDAATSFYQEPDALYVFTDVRFPNEAQRIREQGGQIWQILRPIVMDDDGHVSEQPLPPHLIDATLHNEGTLEEFSDVVKRMLEMIRPREPVGTWH